MSIAFLPSALRAAFPSSSFMSTRRTLSTTSHRRASILFALSALSNSRETQHFNKLSHLNRIEHSPPLKLIKTSEIDPFPLPTRLSKPAVALVRGLSPARSAAAVWDDKALKVGRVILANQARSVHRLRRALTWFKSRSARQQRVTEKERAAWRIEAQKHRGEMRMAGTLILLSVGTATALATWRFWPQQQATDSAALGRKIAERAQSSMGGLPRAISSDATVVAPAVAELEMQTAAASAVEPALASQPIVESVVVAQPQKASWWKSLFWKQP